MCDRDGDSGFNVWVAVTLNITRTTHIKPVGTLVPVTGISLSSHSFAFLSFLILCAVTHCSTPSYSTAFLPRAGFELVRAMWQRGSVSPPRSRTRFYLSQTIFGREKKKKKTQSGCEEDCPQAETSGQVQGSDKDLAGHPQGQLGLFACYLIQPSTSIQLKFSL